MREGTIPDYVSRIQNTKHTKHFNIILEKCKKKRKIHNNDHLFYRAPAELGEQRRFKTQDEILCTKNSYTFLSPVLTAH